MAHWRGKGSGWLPWTMGTLPFTGILLAYITALSRGDIKPFLPFISNAGGQPPQSGIFAIFSIFGIMLGLLTVLVRYITVSERNRRANLSVTILNTVSAVFGVLSMLGCIVVITFPVEVNKKNDDWVQTVRTPHFTGAFVLFASGILYIGLHMAITWLTRRPLINALSITRTIFFIGSLVSFILMYIPINGDWTMMSPNQNKQKEDQFPAHQFSEWLMVFFFLLFFVSFARDFRNVEISFSIKEEETNELIFIVPKTEICQSSTM